MLKNENLNFWKIFEKLRNLNYLRLELLPTILNYLFLKNLDLNGLNRVLWHFQMHILNLDAIFKYKTEFLLQVCYKSLHVLDSNVINVSKSSKIWKFTYKL